MVFFPGKPPPRVEAMVGLADGPPLLLTSQRKQVREWLDDAGFSPSVFQLEDHGLERPDGRGKAATLRYGNTGWRFMFRYTPQGAWFAEVSPGQQSRYEETRPGGWDDIRLAFSLWLAFLQREVEAVDPWVVLADERRITASVIPGAPNDVFTPDEQALIRSRVEAVRALLSQHELTAAQLEVMNDRLDHIEDSVTRVGRKDWLAITLGVFLPMLINDAVPPDVVRETLVALFHGIQHLFVSLGLPALTS